MSTILYRGLLCFLTYKGEEHEFSPTQPFFRYTNTRPHTQTYAHSQTGEHVVQGSPCSPAGPVNIIINMFFIICKEVCNICHFLFKFLRLCTIYRA